jgi:hypothetical protein
MQDHANGFQGSLLLVTAKNGQLDATEKASAAQRMGELRRYIQYRLGRPHTRPPGGVIELIASGNNVQKIVCHGTRAPVACAAVELLAFVPNASEQKGGCTHQAGKDLYYCIHDANARNLITC